MKYKNLKQLKAAYDSGKLSRKCKLMLDNDNAAVYDGEKCVYRTDYPPESELLEEALKMLKIPHEGV